MCRLGWVGVCLSVVLFAVSTYAFKANERLVPKSVYMRQRPRLLAATQIKEELTDPTKTPKIIGGEPTDIAVFPHQLSLRVRDFHVCGASVSRLAISKRVNEA